jgi:hypothetical protein
MSKYVALHIDHNDIWTVTEICNQAVNMTSVVLTSWLIGGGHMK